MWKTRNRNLLEQNPEIANILHNQRKPVLEIENLGRPLQSLHLNAIPSQQKHKTGLAQLEQQITQLERDLTDAENFVVRKIRYALVMRKPSKTAISLKNHIAREARMYTFFFLSFSLSSKGVEGKKPPYFITNFVSTYCCGVCLETRDMFAFVITIPSQKACWYEIKWIQPYKCLQRF